MVKEVAATVTEPNYIQEEIHVNLIGSYFVLVNSDPSLPTFCLKT